MNRKERRSIALDGQGDTVSSRVYDALSALKRKPKEVKGYDNATFVFYYNVLLKKLKGRFKIECPSHWDSGYILNNLIQGGVVCITDTELGVIPLRCGVSGYNVFELPTTCICANPILGTVERTIYQDCVALRLTDCYLPLTDLLNRYAMRLALCDASIDVNLLNTRVTTVFECENSKQAETAKAVYDKVSEGQPAVFLQNSENPISKGMNVFFNNVKQNYIASDVQIEKRIIMEEFLTEIGINNCNIDKRERLNEAEVNSNNEELEVNVNEWKRNLEKGVKEYRKMFGDDFSIELTDSKATNNGSEDIKNDAI